MLSKSRIQRALSLFAAVGLVGAVASQSLADPLARYDFGAASQSVSPGWNTINVVTSFTSGTTAATDGTSGIYVGIVSRDDASSLSNFPVDGVVAGPNAHPNRTAGVNRNPVTYDPNLNNMLSDMVVADDARITIAFLVPGQTYSITMYHHDAADIDPPTGTFNIWVTDTSGLHMVQTGVQATTGTTPSSITTTTVTGTAFENTPTDGRLSIWFDRTAGDYSSIAGLEISLAPVPEPASVMLLGLGGVCTLIRRRRVA